MEYQIMFYGGMAGALVALILAIFLYIKLNISQVVKDLTGFSLPRIVGRQQRTDAEHTGKITNEIKPRKDVDVSAVDKTLQMANETASGHKKHKKHTATWPLGGRTSQAATIAPTTLLGPGVSPNQEGAGETTILQGTDETMLLQNAAETTILPDKVGAAGLKPTETALLAVDETTALAQDGTTILAVDGTTARAQDATTILAVDKTSHKAADETTHQELDETTLLTQSETTVLIPDETTLLTADETTVLMAKEETALLTASAVEPCPEPELAPARELEPAMEPEPTFQTEVDIMIVHSVTTI